MPLLESEVEKALFDKGSIEHDDTTVYWIDRQIPINGSVIDMIGISKDKKVLYVVELKRGEVDGNALSQLLSYIHTLHTFLLNAGDKETKVRGILVGESLSEYMKLALNIFAGIKFLKYKKSVEVAPAYWDVNDEAFKKQSIKNQFKYIQDLVSEHDRQESDESDE